MTKYIQDLASTLSERKAGIKKNAALWANQPVTETMVNDKMKELTKLDEEITETENLLQQKQTAARELVEQTEDGILAQIDNLATGLHTANPEKLNEYGIKPRKPSQAKPLPAKAVIQNIEDDSDGEGFVITIVSQRGVVDFFEIQKAMAANADDKVLAPPYPFYKSTKKLKITDDEVLAGKRYFYRVRGVNATGKGEWSEPVSRVQ